MSNDFDSVVVGAGVVGLAIARNLALTGRDVLIVEQHDHFGTETSARNSEVIHAGIYYSQGSLKAQHCVNGKKALYQYCTEHGLAFKNTGKLIVACNRDQLAQLKDIQEKAAKNGVTDLRLMSKAQVQEIEPALSVEAALHSPSTGIIDSHGLMLSLLGEAQASGAMIAYQTRLQSVSIHSSGFTLQTCDVEAGDESLCEVSATELINACGHSACSLAQNTKGLAPSCVPTPRYAKGNYFRLMGKAPVSQLVYPVPEPGGLGVHITLDLNGQARFGPDVQWLDKLDTEASYAVDADRALHFYDAIRSYWPGLADGALVPDYAGIRPKLELNGSAFTDFMIQGSAEHSVTGLVNLFGIESPGLTACLAIAEHVKQQL